MTRSREHHPNHTGDLKAANATENVKRMLEIGAVLLQYRFNRCYLSCVSSGIDASASSGRQSNG